MAIMASSRIFVKGLPPTITDKEFRNHFAANGREVTDVKIIPHRRIGYVGYKSPEEAAAAVKYFNRTYIRMSRLAVEIARPIGDASLKKGTQADSRSTDQQSSSKLIVPKGQGGEEEKNKKRKREDVDESDPSFQEFLRVMQPSSKRSGGIDGEPVPEVEIPARAGLGDAESDDEYEDVPSQRKPKPVEHPPSSVPATGPEVPEPPLEEMVLDAADEPVKAAEEPAATSKVTTDDEWLRSRTSRVLDLLDDDEPLPIQPPAPAEVKSVEAQKPSDSKSKDVPTPATTKPQIDDGAEAKDDKSEPKEPKSDLATIRQTARLFVRNLPYSATEDDLRRHFAQYGSIEEVHLPVDTSGKSKGYVLVQYADADSAVKAFQASDGIPFQGRLLHIVPGSAKREQGLDEFEISKLPLKQQNIIRKRAEAASSTFNWNSLYMNQDAVNASIANRLGVSKAELLDPTSADAGVKQAIAETTIIQETKAYFAAHGVDLNAFKSHKRGDTAILVKNFPFGTTSEELRNLFEEHGTVLQLLMPPSGTIAIVQFAQPGHAKTAFGKLAYRRIKDSILFLEKAPQGIFVGTPSTLSQVDSGTKDRPAAGVQKLSATELLERDDEAEEQDIQTTSLYVRNLNFSTTTEELASAFSALDGFVSARVKTKLDPKKPGQVLSMGFGFVEFRSKPQAMAAIKTMDGFTLAGHALAVKASHRGLDAADERRREDAAKKAANQKTKIIIKNLPFEATKKDIRALFSTYGQLRSVRVPKKYDSRSRGFAFAEFVTPREAQNALGALKDTHLLGRKLVLDYAEAETIDPEEEIARMQKKVGGQVNKVALQQLTNRSRTKVNIGDAEVDELDLV